MRRKHINRGEEIAFALSSAERDLILEHTLLDPEMVHRLRDAEVSGSKLLVALKLDDVDDLAECVAAEANHCEDGGIRRSLDAVYNRLLKVEAQYTDEKPAPAAVVKMNATDPAKMTAKQGQYLAFIYYYAKIHGMPPAEADLQQYFRVSPPAVHQMILALEARGLIERSRGKARSIRLRVLRSELPDLE